MATDWSGRKYKILADLGENIDMILGLHCPATADMRWYLHSHAEDDGLGAFTRILASLGISLPQNSGRSTREKPGLVARLRLLRRHLHNSRPVDYPWQRAGHEAVPASVVYFLMDEADTARIRQHCRQRRIGESAFFLASLDRVCCESFLSKSSERVWLLPHDFRRALGVRERRGNFTAPLSLRLSGEPTADDIYRQLKELYREGILWGSWIYTNFARLFTAGMIRRAYARLQNRAWFGVYAHMGEWQAEGADGYHFVSAPPATAICPITAGSITWQGRSGFSIQLHESLQADSAAASRLMAEWMAAVHAAACITVPAVTPQEISLQALRECAVRVDA